ncbi:unnamed protein product [Blepharisma stoltei]|uniref:non-specific serine/threonine protein kinase n=1 Tax=Blepharisma stoltei TaxID=1481888 RepID=A0AAU9K753_9CILI|nr:unnamed protein product [Blepharisma stoltei]
MGCCPSAKPKELAINNSAPPTARSALDIKIHPGAFVKPHGIPFKQLYMLGNLIGKGSFGEVRRCTHRLSGLLRAAKIYRKLGSESEENQEGSMAQETEILKLLDHPNIIRIYDFFEDDENYYLVMEYCEGGELFKKISKLSRFSETQAAEIMRQLFSVVSFCHGLGIVHRDLKPENIMIEERGKSFQLKIGDFGTAVKLKENELMEGMVGTIFYMAPEVFTGKYSEKCDIWSCGVIMYILLTGRPPFPGKTDDKIIERIKIGEYNTDLPIFQETSPEALDLIKKMLVPQAERISASEALSHPWITSHISYETVDIGTLDHILENLKQFSNTLKLRDTIMSFIAAQIINNKDFKEIRQIFSVIDKDGDGKIGREDLIDHLQRRMSYDKAACQVEKIIKQVDADMDGYIQYTEYLKASIDKNILLSRTNLYLAFSIFDIDKNGMLSVDELMNWLASSDNLDIEIWKELLKEADKNGDGQIDLSEFTEFLLDKF